MPICQQSSGDRAHCHAELAISSPAWRKPYGRSPIPGFELAELCCCDQHRYHETKPATEKDRWRTGRLKVTEMWNGVQFQTWTQWSWLEFCCFLKTGERSSRTSATQNGLMVRTLEKQVVTGRQKKPTTVAHDEIRSKLVQMLFFGHEIHAEIISLRSVCHLGGCQCANAKVDKMLGCTTWGVGMNTPQQGRGLNKSIFSGPSQIKVSINSVTQIHCETNTQIAKQKFRIFYPFTAAYIQQKRNNANNYNIIIWHYTDNICNNVSVLAICLAFNCEL